MLTAMFIFFGAFAKLLKVTIGFIMFVNQSYRFEQIGSHSTDFHEISYLTTFQESVEKIQVSLKI
jgi:hypothetical protein